VSTPPGRGRSVLLIGNYPPPYGGIPTHLASLVPFLRVSGWTVNVLSLKYRNGPPEDVAGATIHGPMARGRTEKVQLLARNAGYLLREARLLRLAPWEAYRATELLSQARAIHLRQPIDVIAAYHILPAGLAGSWIGAALDVPLITTVFGEFHADARLSGPLAPLARRVLERSAQVLSCSDHCAASVRLSGFAGTARTLYFGIDTQRFAPAPRDEARRAWGLPVDAPIVLYVGRFDEEMGARVALEAHERLLQIHPTAVLMLAGRRGNLSDEIEAAVRTRPELRRIASDVPDERLPSLYQAADVVTVPSLNARACLGLAIAEAMACGIATVVSDAGGGREVCEDGRTGRITPAGDATALAAAVGALLADAATRAAYGEAGRRSARDRFDVRATNEGMARLLSAAAR